MMNSNSDHDRHDFEKLKRWHEELVDIDHAIFNYCSVFIVTETDTAAQDIFRVYRTAFEGMGAKFANLVIFGQHGFSATAKALLRTFHSESFSLPMFLVMDWSNLSGCYQIDLPSGNGDQIDLTILSEKVLSMIETSLKFPNQFVRMGDIAGVRKIDTNILSLVDSVSEIITNVSIRPVDPGQD